jgi:hypothetical protein
MYSNQLRMLYLLHSSMKCRKVTFGNNIGVSSFRQENRLF